jgi:peptidoglycan-associated lipoprotein
MIKRVSPRTLSVTVLCLMMLGTLWGCSGKRVASSSGDATSTTKEKSAAAPVETIKPESLATIPATPEDRPSTLEASRAPLDVPPSSSRSTESPSPSAPSSFAAREGPGLGDIFFDFDQYAIRRDAQPVLEADAAWIKSAAAKSILIEGHCDERGTQAYNLVLGEKRARSTKRYLEDLGVPMSRLKTISYGEMRPFCKEPDETCYQKNRRAHFVVR